MNHVSIYEFYFIYIISLYKVVLPTLAHRMTDCVTCRFIEICVYSSDARQKNNNNNNKTRLNEKLHTSLPQSCPFQLSYFTI